MSKRNQHAPEFKAKVALEALKGEQTVAERGGKKAPEIDEEQVKDLHAKIGELAVANDFCHESSNHGPASEAQDG